MSISKSGQGSEVTVPCLPSLHQKIASCIFCFKSCHKTKTCQNENTEAREWNDIQNRFFKLVDRYFDLKIFSGREGSSNSGGGVGDGSNSFERLAFPQENYKVGCCLDCSSVITSYCEVYHKMKCLEMELDGMLDKLVNIIKYADRVPSRISGFRDWCFEEKVNIEKLMEFRQKFRKNCKLSNSRGFPRLTLKRKVAQRLDPCTPLVESEEDTSLLKSPPNFVISSVSSLEVQQPSTDPVLEVLDTPTDSPAVQEEACESPADNMDQETEFPSQPASPQPEVTEPEPKRLELSAPSDPPKDSTEAVDTDCVYDGGDDDQQEIVELTVPPPLVIPPIIPERFTWTCFNCPNDLQPNFSSFVHLQTHQNYRHTNGQYKMNKTEYTEVLQLNRKATKLKGKEFLSPPGTGTLVNCCPICKLVFKKVVSKVPLMHYVNYHDLNRKKNPLTCKKANCSAYFLTKEQLKQHLRSVHKPKMVKKKKKREQDFKCDKCDKVFKHLNALKRHKLLDCGITKEKMEEYGEIKLSGGMKIKDFIIGKRKSCPICKKLANCGRSRKTWIITHYFEYHDKTGLENGDMENNCGNCKASFRNAFQLETHLKEIHGEINDKFKCVDCGQVCRDFTKLRVHRKGVHKLDEEMFEFVCDFEKCGRKFETEVERMYHKRGVHTEEGGMQMCTVCGKCCAGSGALRNHMKKHVEEDKGTDNLVCEECGKIFENKQKLYRHGELHKAKNEMKFVCGVCGKVCLNGNKLREHGRTHGKEKPFVCQICGVAYAHGHNLRIHLGKKHSEEEGFKNE